MSMDCFPRRSFLYRSSLAAVILLTAGALTQLAWSQFGRRAHVSKGPRAVGLVQLQSNGKARLIPVAIMVDGKFYDASSYKADPVPMALDFGVVYEAFRTGVSQGLLTIAQPGHLRHTWIAEGTWLPAGAKPASKRHKAETPNIEEKDAPPRLHRPSDKTAAPSSSGKSTSPSGSDKPATSASDQKPATPSAGSSTADQRKPASAPKTEASASPSPDLSHPVEDPNRPILRRGKPDPTVKRELMKDFDEPTPSAAASNLPPAQDPMLAKMIPAVSDAGGPDAQSYTYDTKPSEEAAFRAKMLDLASAELRRANPQYAERKTSSEHTSTQHKSSTRARTVRKPATPAAVAFTDVQLRIFDLSNSNEPVLVLSARAPAPADPASSKSSAETHPVASPSPSNAMPLPQEITLVARTNLEGELHKLFFSATDAQHLDVAPRMELIDAVDADGDGRGELLFRRTSDAGSSYAIYRATADQLWPLYEGTP